MSWIINLCNKNNRWVYCFDLRNDPIPKFHRHHFRHVAAKAIYIFIGPENQNIPHHFPRSGNRIKIRFSIGLNVHAIVEFDCLEPLIDTGCGGELIVASDVMHAWQTILVRVKTRLLKLPTTLAPLIIGDPDLYSVQTKLKEGVADALSEASVDWRETQQASDDDE